MEEDPSLDEGDIVDEYFDSASPYYDAGLSECFIGLRVPNCQVVTKESLEGVGEMALQFELLTGVKATLRGGASVW
jgi:hypothetical protein